MRVGCKVLALAALLLPLYPALAQVLGTIDSAALTVKVVRVDMGSEFPIAFPAGRAFRPLISAGKDEILSLGAARFGKDQVGLRIVCELENTSTTSYRFRLGDLTVVDSAATNDLFAVGLGQQLFGHTDEHRKIVQKTEIELKPEEKQTISYLFGVLKDSPSWKLTYKSDKSVELKNAPKPRQ